MSSVSCMDCRSSSGSPKIKFAITLMPTARTRSTVSKIRSCLNPLSTSLRTRSLADSMPNASQLNPARLSFSIVSSPRTVSTRAYAQILSSRPRSMSKSQIPFTCFIFKTNISSAIFTCRTPYRCTRSSS